MSSKNNRLSRIRSNEPVTLDNYPFTWNKAGICKNLKCQRQVPTVEINFEHPQIKDAKVQLCDNCRIKLLKQKYIKFSKKRRSL